MKRKLLITTVAAFVLAACAMLYCGRLITPVKAEPVETPQWTAIQVATATTDATALTTTTSSWAACSTWRIIPREFNGLKVAFYAYGDGVGAGSPDGGTFSYAFYVSEYGGSAQLVASGTATCGAMQMSHDPVNVSQLNSGAVSENYCFADTLGAITTDWMGGVSPQNDGGSDDVSSFVFDRQSAYCCNCIITSISGLTQVWCVAWGY